VCRRGHLRFTKPLRANSPRWRKRVQKARLEHERRAGVVERARPDGRKIHKLERRVQRVAVGRARREEGRAELFAVGVAVGARDGGDRDVAGQQARRVCSSAPMAAWRFCSSR
jgi:hypothetical protein